MDILLSLFSYVGTMMVVALCVGIFIVVFCLYPLPLTFKSKGKIKNLGLKHYTTSEYAVQIVNSGTLKVVNGDSVFFYINEEIPQKALDYNMRTHQGEPRDKVVVIKNLSARQIRTLRFSRKNLAVSHKGDFVFSIENKVTVVDA
ncbi:hypothetical protein FACS1894133_2290 [Clostridia bacterium]|nr:hypothetical protein FACS1894133_2290 [Clostridia bacterium]